ncbi:hypothetical protein TWF481_002547 [Arthrobotrys musiformis]|uniref:C2H2-type domain-containing protein n=1 Tax=Arthrobotrys musiformis TaxID=47236 RepID=A0AAV9VRQ5_9PEZI
MSSRTFNCNAPGCTGSFETRTKLAEHRRSVHQTEVSLTFKDNVSRIVQRGGDGDFYCPICNFHHANANTFRMHGNRHRSTQANTVSLVHSAGGASISIATPIVDDMLTFAPTPEEDPEPSQPMFPARSPVPMSPLAKSPPAKSPALDVQPGEPEADPGQQFGSMSPGIMSPRSSQPAPVPHPTSTGSTPPVRPQRPAQPARKASAPKVRRLSSRPTEVRSPIPGASPIRGRSPEPARSSSVPLPELKLVPAAPKITRETAPRILSSSPLWIPSISTTWGEYGDPGFIRRMIALTTLDSGDDQCFDYFQKRMASNLEIAYQKTVDASIDDQRRLLTSIGCLGASRGRGSKIIKGPTLDTRATIIESNNLGTSYVVRILDEDIPFEGLEGKVLNMAMSFNNSFDDLLGNRPASAYMIALEGIETDLRRVGTRWIPLDEKAALACSLDADEFRRMTRGRLRLVSDVMNFLNTEDVRIYSGWVMVACWEAESGLFLIVRNYFPEDGDADAAGEVPVRIQAQ